MDGAFSFMFSLSKQSDCGFEGEDEQAVKVGNDIPSLGRMSNIAGNSQLKTYLAAAVLSCWKIDARGRIVTML